MSVPSTLAAAQAQHRAGNLAVAESLYRQHLSKVPGDREAAHHLALVWMQTRRPLPARKLLEQILAAAPGDYPAAATLALVCRQLGDLPAGLAAAGTALRLRPADPTAAALLGSLQVMAGAYQTGAELLESALAREPLHPDAAHYLGIARHRQSRWTDALAAYRSALRLRPDDHRLLFNLALVQEALDDYPAAIESLQRALQIDPRRADVLSRLAHVQAMTCDVEAEAVSVARLDQLLQQPDAATDDRVEPFLLTYLPLGDAARAEVLRRAQRAIGREVRALGGTLVRPVRDAGPRLRLGYLSAELGEHAVGSLMKDVFAAHDRQCVDVSAFSLKPFDDGVAASIRSGCDRFHDCSGLSTRQVAERIAADAIDVLIDLSGFTLGARPAVLALRPAPVQIGYLGFIHTYGGGLVDYLLLDEQLLPEASANPPREAVIRTSGCFLPGMPPLQLPPTSRREFGLPEQCFLFASFNNSYKLDAELMSAWIDILAACGAAMLAIFLPSHARDGFLRSWQRLGGDVDRLVVLAKLPFPQHLRRAKACDLALDAFRYHAGATAVSLLAAGLPMLTRAGDSPLSRMGVSLNRLLGMEALIADDRDDYVRRALDLASSPDRLHDLRQRLPVAAKQQAFGAPRRTAKLIEDAASEALARHRRNAPLQSFRV